MKKIVAMMLALMLVLVSVSAMAADPVTKTISITKTYLNGDNNAVVFPNGQVISLTSTYVDGPDEANKPNITASTITVDAVSKAYDVTITFPTYTKVGLYHYSLAETATAAQGVRIDDTPILLSVVVEYDNNGNVVVNTEELGFTLPSEGQKKSEIQNQYDYNQLTINKTVTGTLGDKTKYFDFKVTLNTTDPVLSPITVSGGSTATNTQTVAVADWDGNKAEITFKLKDSETLTIANIPAGVTYTVEEVESNGVLKKVDNASTDPNDTTTYKVTGEVSNAKTIAATGTFDETIINNKTLEPDTGIELDAVPYLMIMAIALMGVAMMIVRRREEM